MSIKETLFNVLVHYPTSEIENQRQDIPRIAFHLGLIVTNVGAGSAVADIGGGLGLFSPGCAALGFNSSLVDDFRDAGNIRVAREVLKRVHERCGVTVVCRDVVTHGVDFAPNTLDAVTSFDSIEHW